MRHANRRTVVSLGLGGAIVASLVWTSAVPAAAAEATATSEPDRTLTVLLRAGSTTDADGDGDVDTATKGDKISYVDQVLKNFVGEDDQETVTITETIDGPGTANDSVRTRQVTLTDGDSVVGFPDKPLTVKRDTPLGEYHITVTATASETATATVTVVVHG